MMDLLGLDDDDEAKREKLRFCPNCAYDYSCEYCLETSLCKNCTEYSWCANCWDEHPNKPHAKMTQEEADEKDRIAETQFNMGSSPWLRENMFVKPVDYM